jgi:hypothetical protein
MIGWEVINNVCLVKTEALLKMALGQPGLEKHSESCQHDRVQQQRLQKSLPRQSGGHKNIGPEAGGPGSELQRRCPLRMQAVGQIAKKNSVPRFQFK